MTESTLNRATHFSIVWAVVLAVLTLVEWNSLDREPMSEQIFLPFIERKITLSTTGTSATAEPGTAGENFSAEDAQHTLQTHVLINFNGPLFLVYFFGPVLIFHALGMLWSRLRRGS
ncbi:Uncharacterised protein [Halioglobus japonicus]|nr:Uncharacterised protein [Halioglobus japonicus]